MTILKFLGSALSCAFVVSAYAMASAPSVLAEPPNHQIILGDAGDVSQWKRSRAPRANEGPEFPWTWKADEKSLQVCYGWCGDIETVKSYGDFFLHLEWKAPLVDAEYHEQQHGNSGIFLQSRYELQILDSYNHPLEGKNDAGAIYEIADAAVNASKPANEWQTYDIQFTAPRFNEKMEKVKNAKVSVWLNGVQIHNERELPHPTAGGLKNESPTGPIRLQDHMDPEGRVEYRNIWIRSQ